MATTSRGDDPQLRDAVMRMARSVAQMRANPPSRKAKPIVAISLGQSGPTVPSAPVRPVAGRVRR